MFRKADRDNLAAVKVLLVGYVRESSSISSHLANLSSLLKEVAEGQDKLLQSHAALEKNLLKAIEGTRESGMRNFQALRVEMVNAVALAASLRPKPKGKSRRAR